MCESILKDIRQRLPQDLINVIIGLWEKLHPIDVWKRKMTYHRPAKDGQSSAFNYTTFRLYTSGICTELLQEVQNGNMLDNDTECLSLDDNTRIIHMQALGARNIVITTDDMDYYEGKKPWLYSVKMKEAIPENINRMYYDTISEFNSHMCSKDKHIMELNQTIHDLCSDDPIKISAIKYLHKLPLMVDVVDGKTGERKRMCVK